MKEKNISRHCRLLAAALLLTAAGTGIDALAVGTSDSIRYANTIAIAADDSQARIIEKAAHVVPTPNQLAALRKEFIAFVHFGPNTFTRREWGTGKEDPRIFDLKTLDTDQWCRSLKEAGIRMVLLTVKHHDGFVIWNSRYTRHGLMSTGFEGGKGDILRDLSASCRKFGIRLGIYLSPADLYQMEGDGLYGNRSKATLRTIPRDVPGRPFVNKTRFRFVVDDYNEYFLNQLFELLTEYGDIDEVWFDGAHPRNKGGQTYHYMAWKELIHTLAPRAVIFGREDVRWCGNEGGGTRDTEWNVIPYQEDPDRMTSFGDLTEKDLGSRDQLYKARFLHYQQAETNTSIREGWFYRDDDRQGVRTADDVFDIYERSVGGNSTFLLNIPPNRDGKFSQKDVDVLREVGKRIRETYSTNLLDAAIDAPKALLDNDDETFIEYTEPIVFTLPKSITLNRLMLQEAVAKRSERVEEHAVDAWINGMWQEIARATNIGYKRILRFQDVTTSRLRLRILQSRLTPAISSVGAYHYSSRPPQLSIRKDRAGKVTIVPKPQGFAWKGDADAAARLSLGCKIYYTVDGSEPTVHSQLYTAPFELDRGTVKAIAVLNGQMGPIAIEPMGLTKACWMVTAVSSEVKGNEANRVLDTDQHTYWRSEADGKRSITIDMGGVQQVRALRYTPPTNTSDGLMARSELYYSLDGKVWKKAESIEFGNLINDPTRRTHYFKHPFKARFVRIETREAAAGSPVVTVAEIDLL